MANEYSKTFMEDRESLEALVALLPEAQLKEYKSFGALALDAGFPGRKMVVYTLTEQGPANVEILTLGAMRMSAHAGPTIEVKSDQRSGTFTFGMVPTRFEDREVYLHVPQKFEFKWKGKRSARDGVNFAPHYAVLVKSRSKPIAKQIGDTCCVRLNTFWELFPDSQVGY